MATELATAYVQIVPSADGISNGISSALGGAVETEGKKAGGKLSSAMGLAMKGGAIAVAAGSAIATGFAAAANATAQYGDNIDKMSQKIGISSDAYQKWDYVMARAGTSVSTMQGSMKTLSAAVQSGSDSFQKLGISADELQNLNKEDLYMRVIEGLSGMEESTERTALATSLLGRAGTELGPLLNEGTDAIREQMQMAEDYGMVMSTEAIAAAATYEDSLTTLQNTFTGLKNNITADFLPAMSSVMDGLALIFSGQDGGIQKVQEGVSLFLQNIVTQIPNVISTGAQLIGALVGAIATTIVQTDWVGIGRDMLTKLSDGVKGLLGIPEGSGFEVIGEMLTGMLNNLPAMAEGAGEAVGRFVQTIGSNMPKILKSGIEILGKIVSGIIQAIPQIVAAVPQVVSSFVKGFTSSGASFMSIGRNIINGITSGISNAVSGMVDAAIKACKKLVDGVKAFFGIASPSKLMKKQVGRFIPEGVAVGITDNIGTVEDAMDDMNSAILGSAVNASYMPSMGGYGAYGADASAFGGTTINVYAAEGQSVREIAEEVSELIQHRAMRKAVAF